MDNILILARGPSLLTSLKELPKNIEYIILCNTFWNDKNYSRIKELYKNKEIYNYFKDKKIILVVRVLSDHNAVKFVGNFLKEFNVIKKYVTFFPMKYKNIKLCKNRDAPHKKKLFLHKLRLRNINQVPRNWDYLPDELFKYSYNDIYYNFMEHNAVNGKFMGRYLDTIGNCIDLAIHYYKAKNIYISGLDFYEKGEIYKIKNLSLKQNNLIRKNKKEGLIYKLAQNPQCKFYIYTYANIPNSEEHINVTNLSTVTNLSNVETPLTS